MIENDYATFDGNVLRIKDGITTIDQQIWNKIPNDCWQDPKREIQVIIPNSVEIIEECTFSLTTSLSELIIPDSVKAIGEWTFFNSGIEEISLPEKITEIKWTTFYHCLSLKNVNLPYRLVKIEGDAFSDCENLRDIIIPSSVTVLGDFIFDGCKRLEKIKVSKRLIEKYGEEHIKFGTNAKIVVYDEAAELRKNINILRSEIELMNITRYLSLRLPRTPETLKEEQEYTEMCILLKELEKILEVCENQNQEDKPDVIEEVIEKGSSNTESNNANVKSARRQKQTNNSSIKCYNGAIRPNLLRKKKKK